MKENELSEKEIENKNELTLEKAKELLEDELISDEKLMKIISSIQIFCKVAYELYSEEQNQKVIFKNESENELQQIEQTEQLKKAA